MDVHNQETRKKNMAAIRGKNTKPELAVRKALHQAGFRYRLHDKKLPGKPDLVFARYRAVLFINGCFWHLHDCHLFKWPKTRPEFWKQKIQKNVLRDQKNMIQLKNSGWRVGIIWECSLKGKTRLELDEIINSLSNWLRSEYIEIEIQGITSDE